MDPALPPPRHGRTRLEVELEFVQCLANPYYLSHLAHLKLLEDPRFIAYLEYLQYFRQPDYAKLLLYPVYTLGALTLLQQEGFRRDIANPMVAQEVMLDMVRRYAPPLKEEEEKGEEGKEEEGKEGEGEGGEGKDDETQEKVNGNGVA